MRSLVFGMAKTVKASVVAAPDKRDLRRVIATIRPHVSQNDSDRLADQHLRRRRPDTAAQCRSPSRRRFARSCTKEIGYISTDSNSRSSNGCDYHQQLNQLNQHYADNAPSASRLNWKTPNQDRPRYWKSDHFRHTADNSKNWLTAGAKNRY